MSPRKADPLDLGNRVASFLKGAWRQWPPALPPGSETGADVVSHLIKTGAGALAWRKLGRHAEVPNELEQVYRVHRCESFMNDIRLEEVVELLGSHGLEPILSKGWAVARRYPESGLRPYGDFDLHVEPSCLLDATRVLASSPQACLWVDLHAGVPELPDRAFTDIRRRSHQEAVGGTVIRTLGLEDQLRHLCLHFARHGGWRPLWLCDIGVYLESAGPDFDWDYCLHGDERLTAWVRAILGLAVRVLDAKIPATIPGLQDVNEPTWLDTAMLREWSRTDLGDSHSRDTQSMASYFWSPWQTWRGFQKRVPNAIEAAFKMRSWPTDGARHFWHRLGYCWSRAVRFAQRLPDYWRPSATQSLVQVHVNE